MHQDARRTPEELRGDVGARDGVGRRRERHHLHRRQRVAHVREPAVFGAEIVAPLRDAMRLVDGEPPHPRSPQPRQQALAREPLRRNEEEPQLAGFEAPPERPAVARIVGVN